MKQKIVDFIKRETVLVVALILACISMVFVRPSVDYIRYINFRVLAILLSLMIVMAGFQKNGLFDAIGSWLLQRTKSVTQLCLVLVFLCFFFSMIITNDVALITFVPFAILTLKKSQKENMLLPIIICQTLAANLGSMLTPLGNPQNLYIYNLAGYQFADFIKVMLPYSVVSAVLLILVSIYICKKENKQSLLNVSAVSAARPQNQGKKNIVYAVLFALSLMVVLRILPYYIVTFIVVIVVFFIERDVLKKVDYSLLLTFIFFFIFTGNLGKIDVIQSILGKLVTGREIEVAVISSQFISNVPAALLLSSFTTDYQSLLIGVNLGGLGTLIASMASLISYKFYAHEYNQSKGKYLVHFTITNITFLIILLGVHHLIHP